MSKIIYGNAVGGMGLERTYILDLGNGKEATGVMVDNDTILDAEANDIRIGKTAATADGVTVGDKDIPAYNTSKGVKVVSPGSKFAFALYKEENYNYTKLQAIICNFDSSVSQSVSAEKVAISDKVYAVSSTIALSSVVKDGQNLTIDFGITNEEESTKLIRYFTYKEVY